jgi:small conductance mechanosensitive channel
MGTALGWTGWQFLGLVIVVLIYQSNLSLAVAQDQPPQQVPTESIDTDAPETPEKVDVNPVAADTEIESRLVRILEATGWFEKPKARVDEGVVFLSGQVDTEPHKEWAAKLAAKTQDVVAVVNRIEVREKSMWDLSDAYGELTTLGSKMVQNSPLILVGLLCLALTWWASGWTARITAGLFQRRMKSILLGDVASRAAAIPVFLLGLYLVLKISGLTRLAMTVLGGTGLVALVIGFAFRDIAENFLASILISIQRPFAMGDLIEVAGHKGYLQSVNTRSALLMTLEGNHVQIPNATIYKETITNFTANPNARFDFTVGIGYDDSISKAQSIALKVLEDHAAVVSDPESMVLVESLGAATVNLRVYFWINIAEFSAFKVRSAVIRLTKRAFDQAGISMPDEAREVVFPAGVPVRMISEQDRAIESLASSQEKKPVPEEEDASVNEAEGDLSSEANEIEQQARQSRSPEAGQNLFEN